MEGAGGHIARGGQARALTTAHPGGNFHNPTFRGCVRRYRYLALTERAVLEDIKACIFPRLVPIATPAHLCSRARRCRGRPRSRRMHAKTITVVVSVRWSHPQIALAFVTHSCYACSQVQRRAPCDRTPRIRTIGAPACARTHNSYHHASALTLSSVHAPSSFRPAISRICGYARDGDIAGVTSVLNAGESCDACGALGATSPFLSAALDVVLTLHADYLCR